MQHHPDKNPGPSPAALLSPRKSDADKTPARTHTLPAADDPDGAHAKFQEIGNAYAVLSDPNQRAAYDSYGPDFNERGGGRGGGGGGAGGMYDHGASSASTQSLSRGICL